MHSKQASARTTSLSSRGTQMSRLFGGSNFTRYGIRLSGPSGGIRTLPLRANNRASHPRGWLRKAADNPVLCPEATVVARMEMALHQLCTLLPNELKILLFKSGALTELHSRAHPPRDVLHDARELAAAELVVRVVRPHLGRHGRPHLQAPAAARHLPKSFSVKRRVPSWCTVLALIKEHSVLVTLTYAITLAITLTLSLQVRAGLRGI